jgi:hypothetical protein
MGAVVTYFEAWSLWFSGQLTDNHTLWGLQILWWGRFGKLLAFISALVIVVDIIGAEKLRKAGAKLHTGIDFHTLVSRLFSIIKWNFIVLKASLCLLTQSILWFPILTFYIMTDSKKYSKHANGDFLFDIILKYTIDSSLALFTLLISVCVSVLLSINGNLLYVQEQNFELSTGLNQLMVFLFLFTINFIFIFFFFAPFIAGLLLYMYTTLLIVLKVFFIEPIAWILERKRLEMWVRIISVLLLLIGFHFDLLGS